MVKNNLLEAYHNHVVYDMWSPFHTPRQRELEISVMTDIFSLMLEGRGGGLDLGRAVYYLKLTPKAKSMIAWLVDTYAYRLKNVEGTKKLVMSIVELKLNAEHIRVYAKNIGTARVKDYMTTVSSSVKDVSHVRNACGRIADIQRRLTIEINELTDDDIAISDEIITVAISKL